MTDDIGTDVFKADFAVRMMETAVAGLEAERKANPAAFHHSVRKGDGDGRRAVDALKGRLQGYIDRLERLR